MQSERRFATLPSIQLSLAELRRPTLVLVLTIVSLLSWREGEYYSGGVDPVVAAKAALALVALSVAFGGCRECNWLERIRPRTAVIVLAYVACSTMGAWAGATLLPTGVLAVRVLLVTVTVFLVVVSNRPEVSLISFLVALAAVAVTLALAGLPTLAEGRLSGGLIPTSPNQLAMLLGPPTLACLWMSVGTSGQRSKFVALMSLFLVLTYLTGSRTALTALAVGVAVILLANIGRLPAGGLVSLFFVLPALLYMVLFTTALGEFFGRGGTESVTTLNSRTIAWQTALADPRDFWGRWFGSGLSVRTVEVRGTYWDAQVLDSSWLSGYVQAGLIGVILLLVWVVSTLAIALTRKVPARSLWVAIILYTAIRSLLQTGLLDTYALFLLMLLPSLRMDLVSPLVRGGGIKAESSADLVDGSSEARA